MQGTPADTARRSSFTAVRPVMSAEYSPRRGARQTELLHQCLRERSGLAPEDYTLFFTTGEGRFLPISHLGDDVEEVSGFLLDRQGRVFYFWFGWDPVHQAPSLITWEQTHAEPHWAQSAEYRRARERLGLPQA
jgi:hypothetical protein